MAKKDFDLNENVDKDKGIDSIKKKDGKLSFKKKQNDENSITIKNAHASGDGSYGRNDESLPENEDGEKSTEPSY